MGKGVGKKRNPHAVGLGALGASKGGKRRWGKLTRLERSRLARWIVMHRWNKKVD